MYMVVVLPQTYIMRMCLCQKLCIASQTIYTGAKFQVHHAQGLAISIVWERALCVCQCPRLGDSAQRASTVTSQVAHSSPTRASHNSCDAIRMDLHSRLSDPPSYLVTALDNQTKNRRYTHAELTCGLRPVCAAWALLRPPNPPLLGTQPPTHLLSQLPPLPHLQPDG